MDDIVILETIERFLAGELPEDERLRFEELRKTNPEVDQAVVEHSFFLQQMNRFEDVRQFKSTLNETHANLAEQGVLAAPKITGKAKVVYLFNRYKRTAGIAASIAGITALCMSALVWSFSPAKNGMRNDVELLSGQINDLKSHNRKQDLEINRVKNKIETIDLDVPKDITYVPNGTGFLINAKGYLVTNAHVVDGARYIAVQKNGEKELRAFPVYVDAKKDIAILRIVDTAFKGTSVIPYAIRKTGGDIAEPVFSLGYPRKEIVYGEGYLAAKTGYNGDTLAVQITINANRGNSGSPIINKSGEIIGVLSGRQTTAEGAVFAIQSKYIYEALSSLRKEDTAFQNVKLPTTSALKGAERTQQVKKISDFIYMVKVNNNQ